MKKKKKNFKNNKKSFSKMTKKISSFVNSILKTKRAKYIATTVLFIVFTTALTVAFGAFTNMEKKIIANITVAGFKYQMKVNNTLTNTVKAAKNDVTFFNVELTAQNDSCSRYELIYEVCTNQQCTTYTSIPSNFKIEKSSLSAGEITDDITGTGVKTIKIAIINDSYSDIWINLDIKAGFCHNTLDLVGVISGVYKENNKTLAVAAGDEHSYLLSEDGTLYVFGSNNYGQLGDGTLVSKGAPTKIKNDTKFKSVAAGSVHGMAISEDGDLYTWGWNQWGQLGDGTTQRRIPTLIMSGTKFKAISAGYGHSLAIAENGDLYAWGDNSSGQLGDGSWNQQNSPILIMSGTKFKDVSAGKSHNLAISENGNLYIWGQNSWYQNLVPTLIMNSLKFKAIAAGYNHSLAIAENGNLYTWGDNRYGQLGSGEDEWWYEEMPTQIMWGTRFKAIGAGENHSLAISENGNLYSWGRNNYGQLGNNAIGIKNNSFTPILIMSGKNFNEVDGGSGHSIAKNEAGEFYTWGHNNFGQLGIRMTGSNKYPLNSVLPNPKFKAIAAGVAHSLLVGENGDLYHCGRNEYGELGDLTSIPKKNATLFSNSIKFKSVAAGMGHNLGISESGDLYTWGWNQHGQLGNGNTSFLNQPTQIMSGTKFKAISSNENSSSAITEAGDLYTWGSNTYGVLGDGTSLGKNVPTLIMSGTKFKDIAGGWNHNLAIAENGDLYTWGWNMRGQLGDGGNMNRNVPMIIMNGTKFKAVAGGYEHSLAITENDNLYAWGNGNQGQLGNGSGSSNFPVLASSWDGAKFKAIAAGDSFSLGISQSGDLYHWGSKYFILFAGTTEHWPTKIMEDNKFKSIMASRSNISFGGHAMLITESGDLYVFGNNWFGQLCDGSAWQQVPTLVKI